MIQLFPKISSRTCFSCVFFDEHDTDDGLVSYCTAYDETIDSEVYSAEDCSTYEWSPQ